MQFQCDGTSYHLFFHPQEYYYDTDMNPLSLPGADRLDHLAETVRALMVCHLNLAGYDDALKFHHSDFFDGCPQGFDESETITGFQQEGTLMHVFTDAGRVYTADRATWSRYLVYEVAGPSGKWEAYEYAATEDLPADAVLYFQGSEFPVLFISEAQYAQYHEKVMKAIHDTEQNLLEGQSLAEWIAENETA